MFVSRLKVRNWKNFRIADVSLDERKFLVGPNGCGKSNFLDIFRFMRDIVKQPGGGLQKAVNDRGGMLKTRCLYAAPDENVELEFHFNRLADNKNKWKYIIGIQSEGKSKHQTLISKEEVWKNGKKILSRPDENDKKDQWRLTQTHLEQINSNQEFRGIYTFFDGARYFHIIPQLVRNPGNFFSTNITRGEDAFGFHFLDNILDIDSKTRRSRLKKIGEALQIVVPRVKRLAATRDERGVPHLEAVFNDLPPNARIRQEDQFSDGTLRLIGLLWSILETNSLLLLEEPELSLHSAIVAKIPSIIYRLTRKEKRQLMISTHSPDLLSDPGIGGEDILLFISTEDGTQIQPASSLPEIRNLLESGLLPSEVIIPYTRPEKYEQLELFG
ncbi:MAG: AAA family ATPase [bacterium]|nr:AAA family ATPase [bacterium]